MNKSTISLLTALVLAPLVAFHAVDDKLARPTPEQVAWQDMELEIFIHSVPWTWQDTRLETPVTDSLLP